MDTAIAARSRPAVSRIHEMGCINTNHIGGIAAYFGKVER